MSYFIFELLLLLPLLVSHFPCTTAAELYEVDKILIGYMKHPNSFEQFCANKGYEERRKKKNYASLEYKMKAIVGRVYLLRVKWKCDEIGEKFADKVEKNGCKMYRKYLEILYEYLFGIYAGIPVVKPKFYFDKTFTYSTMKETVENLSIIWRFYFDSEFAECKGHKLERLFARFYEPKLFNEDELNYETNLDNPKETAELFVQMGFESKEENGKRIPLHFDYFFRKYNLLLPNPDLADPLEDVTLIAFLRGPSHFEDIFTELENEEKEDVSFKWTKVKDKEELAQKHQSKLSLLYLMKQSWNCAKIVKQRKDGEKVRIECEKFGKYLNILYEYFFETYAKTEVAQLADLGPAVRPLFEKNQSVLLETLSLSDIIGTLDDIASNFFKLYGDNISYSFRRDYYYDLYLPNADKLVNYQADFGKRNKSMRKKFDTKLKTILKKARNEEKMYKKDIRGFLPPIVHSPFYDNVANYEDRAFIAFLKDEAKFKQVDNNGELLRILEGRLTDYATVEQKIEFLTQKFEAHLGVVYLMRKHWHCAKVSGEFEHEEQTKCQEYRKYLNILSKYFFSVGAEEEDEDPVKAINSQLLIIKFDLFGTLTDVVRVFNRLSSFFFDPKFRQKQNYKLENVLENLKISRKSWGISIPKFERIFESVTENEAQMFKDETFDNKMEEMYKRAEENEHKETEKLDPKKIKAEKEGTMEAKKMKKRKIGIEEPMEEEEIKEKSAALADKFGTLLNSPEKSMEEEKMKSAAFDDKFGTLLESPFYPNSTTTHHD